MKFKFLFILLIISTSTFAQNERRAAKIAAMYMYNFLTLTEIEGLYDADQTEISTLFICSDEFSKNVEKHWNKKYVGKEVGGLPISSDHSSSLSAIKKADIVFVSNDCEQNIQKIKKEIGDRPILFVGYRLAFGVPMINFIYQDNKLRFSINKKYAESNGIQISESLGMLAVNEIASEKEWKNVMDKLTFELANNKDGTLEINAEDLDALLSEYRNKEDALMMIEESLLEKDQALRLKDKAIARKDSLQRAKEIEIVQQEEKLAQLNKDIELKKKEIGEQQDTIGNQQLIIFFSILLLIIAITAGILVYKNYKDKKKANEELAEQKRIVDLKNEEITDSINYAKRIQSAILPPKRMLEKYLPQYFVLYEPKDIVAGDFYWLESIHEENEPDLTLFAVADCTGHGVPGAMVSVICNNGLNRSVHEHGKRTPGEILDKCREIVVREFAKSDEEVKDGMDIALCGLKAKMDENGKPVEGYRFWYAGANNPLWIIRKGSTEVEEIKANKQPIGKYDNYLPYDTFETELHKGDSIYIFSDGFADQFGGYKGKKFKPKNFKKRLLEIQDLSLVEQRAALNKTFYNWKGSLEQLDDVCVIGVRI